MGIWFLSQGATVRPLFYKESEQSELRPSELSKVMLTRGLVMLGKLGEAAGSQAALVSSFLLHPEGTVRRAAADTLGVLGSQAFRFTPDLVKAFHDSDNATRLSAAMSLGRFGEVGAAAAATLLSGTDERTLSLALTALRIAGCATDAHIDLLASLLNCENANIRRGVVEVLGAIGPSASSQAPQLVQLIQEEDDGNVREAAVVALGCFGSAALPWLHILSEAMDDADMHVRNAAAMSIESVLKVEASSPQS